MKKSSVPLSKNICSTNWSHHLNNLRCTGNSGHCHLFFFKQPSDDTFS
ncbi:hypothetical protein G3S71_005201 [Shigella dysenteriae]|nr:hypothetical protein [Shigella dysenteriae]